MYNRSILTTIHETIPSRTNDLVSLSADTPPVLFEFEKHETSFLRRQHIYLVSLGKYGRSLHDK